MTRPRASRFGSIPRVPASTIAFDIEVAGFPWEEVDEITRGYLLSREADKDKREAIPERTGLYPGLGKIIAIGMWLVGEDRGLILLEGKSEDMRDWSKVPNAKIFRGDGRIGWDTQPYLSYQSDRLVRQAETRPIDFL